MKKLLLIGLSFLLLIVGCDKKTVEVNLFGSDYNDFLVRVTNNREEDITVIIGPADFGVIAPLDTTEYKAVNSGDNDLYLNGEIHQNSPVSFGTGSWGGHWIYYFSEYGSGFYMEGLEGYP